MRQDAQAVVFVSDWNRSSQVAARPCSVYPVALYVLCSQLPRRARQTLQRWRRGLWWRAFRRRTTSRYRAHLSLCDILTRADDCRFVLACVCTRSLLGAGQYCSFRPQIPLFCTLLLARFLIELSTTSISDLILRVQRRGGWGGVQECPGV